METARALKFNLSDINTLTPTDIEEIETFFNTYTTLFHELISTINIEDFLDWETLKSRGKFRDQFLNTHTKTYLNWDMEGNKAKYFRIMIGQIRQQVLSIREKIKISRVCQSYDYNISRLNEIREELIANDIYPTNALIRNICKAKQLPNTEKELHPILDFTIEDDQISQVDAQETFIEYRIKVGKTWKTIRIVIPVSNIRPFTGKFARPVLQRDKTTQQLYIRVAYEAEIQHHKFNPDIFLGVDLGKIKPFASSIVSKDGSYSTELTATKEIQKLVDKINVLQREKEFLYAKRAQKEALMTGVDETSDTYFDLMMSYFGIDEQIRFIRTKQKNIRNHLAWLVARDIVGHATHYNVGVVKLENLSVFDTAGTWNRSDIATRIMHVAALHGIEVFYVNASKTSHTDPFTDDETHPNSKREVKTSAGVFDRDYVASLETGRRPGKNADKKKRRKGKKAEQLPTLHPKKKRDKHLPTPKRPKQKTRKGMWKQKVKPARLAELKTKDNSGYDIAVRNLGTDSVVKPQHTVRHVDNTIKRSHTETNTKLAKV